ncbi:MAG TPA: methyltransferase domain-containing protein [Methylomirabilota bacterium]|jgi:ubiquinone/menaquinone biosynthesis C-methylase UbiE
MESIKDDERSWQDVSGGELQERAYARPGTRTILHGQFARAAAALEIKPQHRVLDVGCGAGHFLRWLGAEQPDAQLHGVDLSPNSVRRAQRVVPRADIRAGDAEALPYEDASFDRVVCNGAAHHFPDTRRAFGEMWRVLSPGGRLVMYEPTSTSATRTMRRLVIGFNRYESPADLAHKEEFTATLIARELAHVGFTEIRTSLHDFLAYPLSGNYIRSPLSGSPRILGALSRCEQALTGCPGVRHLGKWFAWRILVVAEKPYADRRVVAP